MQHIDFGPIRKRTSRIGFGCGRLVGRDSLRDSAKLVETALELGIRYFDVAPSYGMGTAEEVVGAVIGHSREVTVATKVGVPRPPYSARANRVRSLGKQVTDRFRPVKLRALRVAGLVSQRSEGRRQFDFSAAAIRTSLEESLQKLRRDSVDVLLAHEPDRFDLCKEMAAGFQSLQEEGLITAFGVGVGAIGDRWQRFGSIWQSCWSKDAAGHYAGDVEYIWHGAIRTAFEKEFDGKLPRPSEVVTKVLEDFPTSILLVSASTPQRLGELLGEIEH